MVALSTFKVLATLIAPAIVSGHGAMYFPVSRNVHTPTNIMTGANGPSVCGSGEGTQWPVDDLQANSLNSALTTPLTELKSGGSVEVEMVFTALHQGHAVLELCANPGPIITEDCFVRLQRNPSDTRYSPYAVSAPEAFFMPVNECMEGTQAPPRTIRTTYQIPAGIVSDHAVLRWAWQTGNSCDSHPSNTRNTAAPEVEAWEGNIFGKTCRTAITGMGKPCGTACPTLDCTNEQFRNCADVKIVPGTASDVVTRGEEEIVIPTSTRPAQGTGAASGDGLEDCVLRVSGIQPHFDAHCKEMCVDYATEGSQSNMWCKAAGKLNIAECVAAQQTACALA